MIFAFCLFAYFLSFASCLNDSILHRNQEDGISYTPSIFSEESQSSNQFGITTPAPEISTHEPDQPDLISSNPTTAEIPQQTESPSPDPTTIEIPPQTELPSPDPTTVEIPPQTELPSPDPTTVEIPPQTESPSPDPTTVEIPPQTELPSPDPTTAEIPQQTESPSPDPTATEIPPQTDLPTPARSPSPIATEIPTETPLPSISPEPKIDESEKIYVCEGSSCDSCGKNDEEDHEIQLKSFTLLDELLSINNQPGLEITICGSTRENHPAIRINLIENKRVEFKGKKTQQYITFIDDSLDFRNDMDSFINIESKRVTFIVDESSQKQNFKIEWAELENSPIEVENLTLKEVESDLISLSSVRNTIFSTSSTIEDDSIQKILIGNDYITYNPINSRKFLKKSKKDSDQVTLHAINDKPMDIKVSLKTNRLDLTSSSDFNEANAINNIIIDLKNDEDKKAIIVFDSTWNKVQNIDLLLIKHECNLDIFSDSNEFAKKINIIGDGTVSRNGQIDGEIVKESKKTDYFTIIVICLVVALVILIGIALFIIFRKKCCRRRSGSMQNYNEYLNNSDELDPINMPV